MKPACRRRNRHDSGVTESPARLVLSRKYRYSSRLSFSACLAENPDPFLFLPRDYEPSIHAVNKRRQRSRDTLQGEKATC
jgi:hypothetical protein